MHRLLDMGVDGIVADDPRLLMQVLQSRRPRRPGETKFDLFP
jgi:hypothetical protein